MGIFSDMRRNREWRLQCEKEDAERWERERIKKEEFREAMLAIENLNPDWELDEGAIFFKKQTDKGVFFGVIDGCDCGDDGGLRLRICIYPGKIELGLFRKAYVSPMNLELIEIFSECYVRERQEYRDLQDYRSKTKVWIDKIAREKSESENRSKTKKECVDFFKDIAKKA